MLLWGGGGVSSTEVYPPIFCVSSTIFCVPSSAEKEKLESSFLSKVLSGQVCLCHKHKFYRVVYLTLFVTGGMYSREIMDMFPVLVLNAVCRHFLSKMSALV